MRRYDHRLREERIPSSLISKLRSYHPRCIALGEDPITAHRYAAKVELAQELLRMLERQDQDDLSYQED